MRKRIALASALGLIILAGFNNCGEGFQAINFDQINLDSQQIEQPQPNVPPANLVQINIKKQPELVTNQTDEIVEYELLNISDEDQLTCKLNSATLDDCDSPIELANLTEGTQKLDILINDGNCDTCIKSIEWNINISTVDTTPIEITLDSAPQKETESTTASFAFNFSEMVNTMNCKLNGDDIPNCSNPQNFDSIPEGDSLFEIIVTDLAGNETIEKYDWKVIKKEPEPGEPVLEFQFDKSGKGVIEYNRAIEEDTKFLVILEFDAPVKDFLRVLYSERLVPFRRDIGVTIKAGNTKQEFSFEEVLRPILDLEGNIPDKVIIRAELHKYNGYKRDLYKNQIIDYTYIGKPDAIKAAYESINYAVFLSNSNKIIIKSDPSGTYRSRVCQTNSLAFTSDNYPVLISNGGANIFYILTNKNEIWKHDCLSIRNSGLINKLPDSIRVKEISASHYSFIVLSDDNKAYVVNSAGHRQIYSSVKIKEIKMIHQNSSPADAVIMDVNNNIHLPSSKLRTSNSFSKKDAVKLFSEVWNVFILYRDGRIASVEQSEDNKLDLRISSFNPSDLVDWNQINRKTIFTSVHSAPQNCSFITGKRKVIKVLTRGNVCWTIGGTISEL